MSQYRKDLPPLDNLLFFHAAANNPSLSSAAQELFVTQSAVSKRIQRFEIGLEHHSFHATIIPCRLPKQVRC